MPYLIFNYHFQMEDFSSLWHCLKGGEKPEISVRQQATTKCELRFCLPIVSFRSLASHSPFGQSLRPYLIYNCYSVNVIQMLFALCAFKLPLLKFWEPVSIHNIYNVPLGAGASSGGPEGRSCELILKSKFSTKSNLQS